MFLFLLLADINECLKNISGCDLQANCTDTDGSYMCACNAGFYGSGQNCTGVYYVAIMQ